MPRPRRRKTENPRPRPNETITAVVAGAAAIYAAVLGGDLDTAAVLAAVGAVPALITTLVERSRSFRQFLGRFRKAWASANSTDV